MLLYRAECWVPLRRHRNKLDTFHHLCIRTILGISNLQPWSEHITMVEVWKKWGDEETAADKVKRRRLEWFGNLARMDDNRLPNLPCSAGYPNPDPDVGQESGGEM